MLTNDGIITTFFATKLPRRATAGGTTRTPDRANARTVQMANLFGTLS